MSYLLKNISKDILENTIKSVYVFYGNESFLMEEGIAILRNSMDENASINYASFNGEDLSSSIEDIIALCNTTPFLASKRLIVLRNIHKLNKFNMTHITKYVGNPSKFTTLILTIEGQVNNKEAKKGLGYISKALSTNGTVIRFDPLKKNALASWITHRVESCGKKIDTAAVYLLMEIAGANTWSLSTEIEKLCLYVGSSDKITSEDVEKLVTRSHETSIFRFLDALFDKKKVALIRLCELEYAGLEPLMVVNMIENQAIMHYQILKAKDTTKMGLKIAPYQIEKIKSRKSTWSLNQLDKLLTDIRKIEHSIKTGSIHPFASMIQTISSHIFERKQRI
ncbi:MAG: DNA polymerase III subunit delta [Thermodesulfobacteriota bacterium]|nr:DNA polymerase III subunit delta [Thermodesulfobacteriota bacterium]